MALEAAVMPLEGSPRIGPVPSATSRFEAASRASQRLRQNLWDWQRYALHESLAVNADGKLRWREFAAVVSRRNGKTKMLDSRVLADMDAGRRVLHTAHNRILPRKTLFSIAGLDRSRYKVREANGQEEVKDLETGGSYKILAPQRGARGEDGDTLIVDEIREFEDWSFIAAAEPIVASSEDPQVIYLSNAGSELSVVLNDLRVRGLAGADGICYLEWSADPVLPADDVDGWLQANPSVGQPGSNLTIERLRSLYEKYRDAGELAIWETEHLCRWVQSMLPRLVSESAWSMARAVLEPPRYPALGLSVDPSGQRASAVLAWPQIDGSVAVTVVADVTGTPVDVDQLGYLLQEKTGSMGLSGIAFDPWTDKALARFWPDAKSINGQEFANASQRFVRLIETGALHWQTADAISEDLPFAARKTTAGNAFIAERASSSRSITALLAAVRAVWIASAPLQRAVLY